jgi:hypothetical protein
MLNQVTLAKTIFSFSLQEKKSILKETTRFSSKVVTWLNNTNSTCPKLYQVKEICGHYSS